MIISNRMENEGCQRCDGRSQVQKSKNMVRLRFDYNSITNQIKSVAVLQVQRLSLTTTLTATLTTTGTLQQCCTVAMVDKKNPEFHHGVAVTIILQSLL